MERIYKYFDLGSLQKEIMPPSFDGLRKKIFSALKQYVYDSGNPLLR